MSWERLKSTVSAKPEEPSFSLWLMLGIVALVGSVMLFVLHANKFAGPLQEFNIWIVTVGPLVVWFFFLCLQGWLYNSAFDKYEFEANEAEYAQQQWAAWAGRNIAVLHSNVIFPDALTPVKFVQAPAELLQHTFLTRRLSQSAGESLFPVLLGCAADAIIKIPSDLPFNVTLLTDIHDDESVLQTAFADAWQAVVPGHPIPLLNILTSKSFLSIDERLKSPTLDVDLILINQAQGRDGYSDVQAALLLTSDDVVTKYQLIHEACILRPMPLYMAEADSELEIFFSTQTQANTTDFVVGDKVEWSDSFPALLDAAQEHGGIWKPEQTLWLEKYSGISGPFSPWVMAAVVSDIVNIQKADCLMLSSDGENTFINTVQTGNINNDNR